MCSTPIAGDVLTVLLLSYQSSEALESSRILLDFAGIYEV